MKWPISAFPAVLLLTLLGTLVGCNRSPSPSTPETVIKRNVLCVVYPVADIVRQVAGEQADVQWHIQWFCENGLDPRDLNVTDDRKRSVHDADLVITSGFPERWTGDMLDPQERAQRVIGLDALTSGLLYPAVHGDLWLDPHVVMDLTEAVRQRLSIRDDRREIYYRRQADAYVKQLKKLDDDLSRQLALFKGRRFLALRPTWMAMAKRYGLEEIAPIDTTPQKLSDDQVQLLQQTAKDNGTNLLAVEASVLPGVKRELQLRTGLTLLPMDSLGTSASDGRSTYIHLMRYNLDQLCQGLR
jgi:zinc transport system substrate-binding protein